MMVRFRFRQCFRAASIIVSTAIIAGGCSHLQDGLKGGFFRYPVPVLEYCRWAGNLSESEVTRERELLSKQKNSDPAIHQVQLAILLSIPQSVTVEEEVNAITALEQSMESLEESYGSLKKEYQTFARMWLDVLVQRRQQRRLINKLHTTETDLNRQIQLIEERNKVLLDQIDALKSIEEQINRRENDQITTP